MEKLEITAIDDTVDSKSPVVMLPRCEQMPEDDDGYPNEYTKKILKWCEAADNVKKGDEGTLPKLVKGSDTETLKGIYERYDEIFEDNEKLGNDVAAVSEWDLEVMLAVHQELRSRGVVAIPPELNELVEAMDARKKSDTGTVH